VKKEPEPVAVYTGSLDDTPALIQFFRREKDRLRSLRKLVISPERTVLWDVNRDRLEFPGLTYGAPALEALLRELGVVFQPQAVRDPAARVTEFDLSVRHPWGEDRVM
jgi:hypothetical protein